MTRLIKHRWPRPNYGPAPTVALWATCAVSGTLLFIVDHNDPTNETGRFYLLTAVVAALGAVARTLIRNSRQRTADIVAALKQHERDEETVFAVGIEGGVERLVAVGLASEKKPEAPRQLYDAAHASAGQRLATVHAINGARRAS
jgi:hypothetical protein